jgi:uncharacterized membrane protein YkvA (DUF1232 family)
MFQTGRLFRWWSWLKILRDNAMILFFAWRHPLTPAYMKGLLTALALYIVSPIDLLPDYLPVVGIADDTALLTGAVLFLTNLLPAAVVSECRQKSGQWSRRLPYILALLAVMAAAWIALIIVLFHKVFFSQG